MSCLDRVTATTQTRSRRNLQIGARHRLHPDTIAQAAADVDSLLALDQDAEKAITHAHQAFGRAVQSGREIYGTTTGFGPFVKYASSGRHCDLQGKNLIAHLGAGSGDRTPLWIVRIAQIIRAHCMSQGRSGTRLETVHAYLKLFNDGMVPSVPQLGSLGASGDLVPLAHIVRALTGETMTALLSKERLLEAAPQKHWFTERNLQPPQLSSRDALSMVNGTSFSTAWLVAAHHQTRQLIEHAETLTGWLYATLGARIEALDPRLHSARGHPNQVTSAAKIRQALEDFTPKTRPMKTGERALQEIYSVRCAPQVLGACRDNLDFAENCLNNEINGISDNPVIDVSGSVADPIHGGNFFAQQIAFAADLLNLAITQTAALAERQIDALFNPEINNGAPLLLAYEPGATRGLAGAQITASAVLAEMRQHAYPGSITSIPTNGGNQDIVPMANNAARNAYFQCSNLATILSVLARSLEQYRFLAQEGKINTTPTRPNFISACCAPIIQDRALEEEIADIQSNLLDPKSNKEDIFKAEE